MEAAFGAGCFWHVEEEFSKLGVLTRVGYMGGSAKEPTYKQVCSGKTGHAEAVHVEFDPKKLPYSRLLKAFWRVHDPTQKDRQGPDVGSQYRSVIFYYNRLQEEEATASLKKEQARLGRKVQTAIEPAKEFWEAEEYHQGYFKKHKLLCRISNAFT